MAQVSDPGVKSHLKGFLKAVNSATTTPVSEMPIDQARGTYTYGTTVGDKPDLSGTGVIEKTINEDGLAVSIHITGGADDKTGRAKNN